MSRLRKAILILLSYILAFVLTVGISGFMVNQGKISGDVEETEASLPVVYVKTGGKLMNEMHGYTMEVDAGYYRDTLTAVGNSKTINLSLDLYDYDIISGSFELYNDSYDTLIESGDCSEPEMSGGMMQLQIVFGSDLSSNREYCLRIMLTDADGEMINYYTRVRYGADLKVAEKLEFVLDFNEATFDKDSAEQLENYLESSGTSSSNYSLVTLNSSSDVVTWGDLEPSRTSEIAIRLKEINTETAAFTLSYTIESSADDVTTFYTVTEYYRLRWDEDQIYLLDFERRMQEDIDLSDLSIVSGALRMGIGDDSEIDYGSYGTEDQQYVYITSGNRIWLYDSTNSILTQVYSLSDEGHRCAMQDETGINVIRADDDTGDLYFIVYGYMHSGDYEGQEGVMICHFSHEDVMVEELMFIPYTKGFAQLEAGLAQLAYMNDSGDIYLLLEDTVYEIDVALSRMTTAWNGLNSGNCAFSGEGLLAISEGGNEYGGTELTIIDLNTNKEKNIQGGEWLLKPLGFVGEDMVYGLIDPELVAVDSSGVTQAPMSEILIVDSDLNEVKSYSKSGYYIMDAEIEDDSILLTLGQAVANGAYTDYEDAGEDYVLRNSSTGSGNVYLRSIKDSVRGIENWLQLDTAESIEPVRQTARYVDPGYDITENYTASETVELCYYVYTKGRLAATFNTIQEAIAYGNEYAGTVMSSHKKVAWQRAGRAYVWDLDIDRIEKISDSISQNEAIIDAIVDYEGWEISEEIDGSQTLFEAMTEVLPVETVELSGLEMTDVLHFVYRDRAVVAKIAADSYAIIIGYDENNSYVYMADPATGSTYTLRWSAAKSLFEENGSVFYSYFD